MFWTIVIIIFVSFFAILAGKEKSDDYKHQRETYSSDGKWHW